MPTIFFSDLGSLDYQKTLDIQLSHFENSKYLKLNNRDSEEPILPSNFFFLVEHPHTYTLGKNGDTAHILLTESQMREKNISYYHTNRGGDITYHGPGQIVGYPILDLDQFRADIHSYMRSLEEVIIRTLAHFGLKGERSEGETGVWLDIGKPNVRKICAMGVHTSRWVTMHGFALNVNTDLSYFEGIVPCGIRNKGVTSLQQELGTNIEVSTVKNLLLNEFQHVFTCSFFEYKTN